MTLSLMRKNQSSNQQPWTVPHLGGVVKKKITSSQSLTLSSASSDDSSLGYSGPHSESSARKCQLCVFRDFSASCYGVGLCATCNKFMSRRSNELLDPEKIAELKCDKGKLDCDLTQSRSCAKCRFIKFAILKIETDTQSNELDPENGFTRNLLKVIDLRKPKVPAGKEKVNSAVVDMINKRRKTTTTSENFPNFPNPELPKEPIDLEGIAAEEIHWKLLKVERDFKETRPELQAQNLYQNFNPMEMDQQQFWSLICRCIWMMTHSKLPFLTSLAGDIYQISPLDMCKIADASSPLLFYAETALPHRVPVNLNFERLFVNMANPWREVFTLMSATANLVGAIRSWEPTCEEFSFFSALIICVSNDLHDLTTGTVDVLKILEQAIKRNAHEHIMSQFGAEWGPVRFNCLENALAWVKYVRDIRRQALRDFNYRDQAKASSTVLTVVDLVCKHFEAINNGTPANVDATKIEEMTNQIMKNL